MTWHAALRRAIYLKRLTGAKHRVTGFPRIMGSGWMFSVRCPDGCGPARHDSAQAFADHLAGTLA